MKFVSSYDGNYLIYRKELEDFVKPLCTFNIYPYLIPLNSVLKQILKPEDEIYLLPNNDLLLKDDFYTDGKEIYSKEDLVNIKTLLNITKKRDLFPIEDNTIINEPLTYKRLKTMLDNNMLSNKPDTTSISKEIIKLLLKAILIENNIDKNYIIETFGITYNEKEVFLEEEYLLEVGTTTQEIIEIINDTYELLDNSLLINELDRISLDLESTLTKLDFKDLNIYSPEIVFNNTFAIVEGYLPYGSLRSKVTKYIKDVDESD